VATGYVIGAPKPSSGLADDEIESRAPPGYRYKHDKHDNAVLKPPKDSEDEEPPKALSFFMWRFRKMTENYGTGMFLYFDFVRFISLVNLVLALLGLVSFVPHCVIDEWRAKDAFNNLYISTFSTDIFPYWVASSCVMIIVMFCVGPLYGGRVTLYFKMRKEKDTQSTLAGTERDIIKKNRDVHFCNRWSRVFLSYIIFVILLFLSGVAEFFIVIIEEIFAGSYVSAFTLAIFVWVINWFWRRIAAWMSKHEKHKTHSSKRFHYGLKAMLFRVCSIVVLWITRFFVWEAYGDKIQTAPYLSDITDNGGHGHACGLESTGNLFVIMVIAEIVISIFVEFFQVLIHYLRKRFGILKKKYEGHHARCWPEFDVTEQYIEVLYRQFLIYVGFTIVPILPLIGLIGNEIKYFFDKFHLTKMSKRPHNRLEGSNRGVIVFFLLLLSFFALAMFPIGQVWVLSGFHFREECPDSIFHENTKFRAANTTIINATLFTANASLSSLSSRSARSVDESLLFFPSSSSASLSSSFSSSSSSSTPMQSFTSSVVELMNWLLVWDK